MHPDIQHKMQQVLIQQKADYSVNWKALFVNESSSVIHRLEQELHGYGPLDELLQNPEITEIIVNRFDQVYFERQGRLQPHLDHFYSEQTYLALIERLSQSCQSYLNREKPFIEAQLKHLRITIVFSELSRGHHLLSIRKQPEKKWTLQNLQKKNFLNENQACLIQNIYQNRKNFLVVGATGSGKTSLMQALLELSPPSERVVIIEDTQELNLPNSASISLLTRDDPNQTVAPVLMEDLLKRALRLRPDRLVVGEIRSAEAKSLLLSLSIGHSGSFGSLHAKNAAEALLRLEMLVQMGAPQWSLNSIRKLLAMTINYIFVVQKKSAGRSLIGIFEINSLESEGFTLTQIDSEI